MSTTITKTKKPSRTLSNNARAIGLKLKTSLFFSNVQNSNTLLRPAVQQSSHRFSKSKSKNKHGDIAGLHHLTQNIIFEFWIFNESKNCQNNKISARLMIWNVHFINMMKKFYLFFEKLKYSLSIKDIRLTDFPITHCPNSKWRAIVWVTDFRIWRIWTGC